MLLKIHPRIEQALAFPQHGTILDGVFGSSAIDTSAELLDVAGADISSLNDGTGTFNSEHISPDTKDNKGGDWGTLVGRIIFAKKIFNEDDCESERELFLWRQLGLPFIYGAGELYDADGHENAKAVAAIIKHYHSRNLPILVKYSVEGTTIAREGNILKNCVIRRVALTVKPCNQSSINFVVAEAAKPEQSLSIEKNEAGVGESFVLGTQMQYFPIVGHMAKALTLGGGDVAPSALTGGAALAVEDVGEKKKFMKAQVLAAYRDWDGNGDFKEFLKHRLPDIDDNFINKFAHITQEIRLKKQEALQKDEMHTESLDRDSMLALKHGAPKGSVLFRNKAVKPGEVKIIAGPFQNNKLKLLHVDNNYIWVQPKKAADQKDVKINKISRRLENAHFIISEYPEDVKWQNLVDTHKHGDKDLTKSYEQQQLMHGIDLAADPLSETHPHGATEARSKGTIGWHKSAYGKIGYVKPSVVFPKDSLSEHKEEYIPTAKREAIFHNLAKSFWGLGEHVPTTAVFQHPQNENFHSIMEKVPNAQHVNIKQSDSYGKDVLGAAGDSGLLDKLAIMDTVMGTSDRHRLNYMVSPNKPNLHLIDNSLIFNYNDQFMPAYLHDYHHFKGDSFDDAQLHPAATHWLLSLDPFALHKQLQQQGVHESIAKQATQRLLSMQSNAMLGKNKKNDIMFAHNDYLQG